jgi:DNA-binding NarL/FixJ family response regulator
MSAVEPVWIVGTPGVMRDMLRRVLHTDEVAPGGVGILVEPDSSQWEMARALGAHVVLVTSQPTDEVVVDAVVRGADAIVDARMGIADIVDAIDTVAGGGTLLAPAQVRALIHALRTRPEPGEPLELTARERDILLSVQEGDSIKQTARRLGISGKTVENLQSRLFRKLGVRNRAQAVARAHALGMLPADEGEPGDDAPQVRPPTHAIGSTP